MAQQETYPSTVVEILRNLYFSSTPLNSIDLQEALKKAGIDLDPRTIRYHISNLEEGDIVHRLGKRGVILTKKGIEEAKTLLVFDRIGLASLETQKMLLECNFDIDKCKGKLIVNVITCPKERIMEALECLDKVASSSIIVSPLIGLIDEDQKFWNIRIDPGKVGIAAVSSTNYESIFRRDGVPLETASTGLYKLSDYAPKGFIDLICHSGTTISPGQLLCRGRYTQVSKYLETGSGYVTASIKTFPSFYCDRAMEIAGTLGKRHFNSLFEMGCAMPENYRMTIQDRNKGYLLVYGGANYFAPLIEKGITEEIHITGALFRMEDMLTPGEALDKLRKGQPAYHGF